MEPFCTGGESARPCCFDPSPLFPVSISLMTVRARRGWVALEGQDREDSRQRRGEDPRGPFWSRQGRCSGLHVRRVTMDCFCSCRVSWTRAGDRYTSSFCSRSWVVGAVAGRARPPMERQIKWSDKMQSATLFPPHVACWKPAYVSHGALLVTAFPLLMLKWVMVVALKVKVLRLCPCVHRLLIPVPCAFVAYTSRNEVSNGFSFGNTHRTRSQ